MTNWISCTEKLETKMSSRIISLLLQNVGAYSEYKFEFIKEKNDLIGIIADNARGKTTLIKSFNWLFYGDSNLHGGTDSIKGEQAKDKETSVKMEIETDEGTYMLARSDITGPHVSFKDVQGHPDASKNDFDLEVSRILPEAVKRFFLFDGEFLSSLFEEYNADKLRSTVLNISKVDRWTLVLRALSKAREIQFKDNQRENRNNKKKKEMGGEIRTIKDIIDRKKIELFELDEEIEKAEKASEDAEKNLTESARGDPDVEQKLQKKYELEAKIGNLEGQITILRNNAQQTFLEEISDGLLIRSYLKFQSEIKKQVDKGDIPPHYNLERLEESIRKAKCSMCKHDLTKEEIKEMESLKGRVAIAEERMPLYKLSEKRSDFLQNIKRKISHFKNTINELHGLEKERSDTLEKLKKQESELDKIDEDQFKINLRIHRECLKKLEAINGKKIIISNDLSSAYSTYDTKMRDYNRIPDTSEGSTLSGFALQRIANLQQLFEQGETYSLGILTKELSEKATERYQKIFSKSAKATKYTIELNTNFHFKVIAESTGVDRLADDKLSGGERKTAALSFILALSDVGGFDFPLIIDAPFTALGPTLKNTFLDMICILAEYKQIIFFTLPEDSESMRRRIEESCSHLWELKGPGIPEKLK